MYNPTTPSLPSGVTQWPLRARDWLDDRGRPAWIAATVLGFIAFWPLGLGLLAYTIWSKRMFGRTSCGTRRHHDTRRWAQPTSGNTAFDAYRTETIRRLEEEQDAFGAFLKRLRDAKDKQEFDAFMDDRAKAKPAAETLPTGSALGDEIEGR